MIPYSVPCSFSTSPFLPSKLFVIWKINGGIPYYYRSRWARTRAVQEYVGSGALGRLAEEADRLERQRRHKQYQELKAWLSGFQSSRQELFQLHQRVEVYVRAHLFAAGYFWFRRCNWRKRMKNHSTGATGLAITTEQDLHDLNAMANAGDTTAVLTIQKFLRENREYACQLGDLVGHATEALLQRLIQADVLAGESVRVMLGELKKSLLPDKPTVVQRLAADRVVLIHAEIYILDALYPLISELEPQQARVIAKAKDSAQRRYGLAMKTLEAVNRFLPVKRKKRRLVIPDQRVPGEVASAEARPPLRVFSGLGQGK